MLLFLFFSSICCFGTQPRSRVPRLQIASTGSPRYIRSSYLGPLASIVSPFDDQHAPTSPPDHRRRHLPDTHPPPLRTFVEQRPCRYTTTTTSGLFEACLASPPRRALSRSLPPEPPRRAVHLPISPCRRVLLQRLRLQPALRRRQPRPVCFVPTAESSSPGRSILKDIFPTVSFVRQEMARSVAHIAPLDTNVKPHRCGYCQLSFSRRYVYPAPDHCDGLLLTGHLGSTGTFSSATTQHTTKPATTTSPLPAAPPR